MGRECCASLAGRCVVSPRQLVRQLAVPLHFRHIRSPAHELSNSSLHIRQRLSLPSGLRSNSGLLYFTCANLFHFTPLFGAIAHAFAIACVFQATPVYLRGIIFLCGD